MCKMVHSQTEFQSLMEDGEQYRFFSKTFYSNLAVRNTHPEFHPKFIQSYQVLTDAAHVGDDWGKRMHPFYFL